MTIEIFLIFSLSYLSGSIPFGLILTKIFLNKDLRKIGSKNIGATNVLRTGNKIVAGLTLLFDITKRSYTSSFNKGIFYRFNISVISSSIFRSYISCLA